TAATMKRRTIDSAALAWGLHVALLGAAPAAAASSPAEPVAPVVRVAIERALAVPGARLDEASAEALGGRASSCRAEEAEVPRPVDGSGRIAVKLAGRGARGERCEVWSWVRVRVVAP